MDHLRVFHDVASALTSTLELEDILSIIMEKMAQFFGPERWSFLLVDPLARELYYAIAVGENSETLKGLRVRLGEGVAGWVAATGSPLVVPDVQLDLPHLPAPTRTSTSSRSPACQCALPERRSASSSC